jgi:DNA/RNA-binding protein KIN17
LTEFIKDMALRGVVTIEDTPKGWFMVYKPKDAEETLRTAMNAKRERNGELAEERAEREMEAQLAKIARLEAKAGGGAGGEAAAELVRDEGGAPLRLALAAPRPRAAAAPLPVAADFAAPEEGGGGAARGRGAPPSALAEIMAADEAARDAAARRLDYWLFEGIVVKVMAKELAAQGYYKAKGAVTRVIDRYVAEVELSDGGDVIRVDQAQLETVLPAPGGAVRVVRGAHRGALATLLGVDVDRFKARVRVRRGPADGRELELDYEDVCKLAPNAA